MDNRFRISRDRYNGHYPPSFSSTLLDSIYRSFDDSARDSSRSSLQRDEAVRFREMAVKSSGSCTDRSERRNRGVGGGDGRRSRDRIVDCWMEEFGDRRRSFPTSSSDSSSVGFSSSDTDSFTGSKKNNSLKPIRTSFAVRTETLRPPPPPQSESFSDDLLYRKNRRSSDEKAAKGNGSSGGRSTAKSRAMKFYGDLKRMKQPISPGGKLATFLNSLFNATGNAKKQRISTSNPSTAAVDRCDGGRWERATSTPSCSTASSYSRSCLSKTPSSAGAKRSVRFSPVSVVIDENLTTSTAKSANSKSATSGGSAFTLDQDLKLRAMEKNRRVEEAAMELLRNYNKKWEVSAPKEAVMADVDEDAESCCSSDLFELENLLEIGVDRYCSELPVYETTHVDTNRAIASGLMV